MLLISGLLSAQDFYTVFAKGKWDRSSWFEVKSMYRKKNAPMVQFDDHIMNEVPDLPDEELFRKYASSLYSCLMLNRKYSMPCVISCTMSFDHRMAPLIVIAPGFGKNADGATQHRDHYEIILYDKGINVWHHTVRTDGKSAYRLAGFLETPFLPKKKYCLQVTVKQDRKGKYIRVECDGKCFGFMDPSLPDTFYTGIIGGEGRNRFYDFGVRKTDGKP